MGIVNVTPDSFYPPSRRLSAREAAEAALRLAEEGADLVDIGGQSTRPGSEPVGLKEELERVLPVVEGVAARLEIPISIDTDKAEMARRCLEAGAEVLNDVTALRGDPEMAAVASRYPVVVLMHRGGESPKTMQDQPAYGDVLREVYVFLEERIARFVAAGGDRRRVMVDPGIGFGKDLEHNLSLIKNVDFFEPLGPVVLGLSRKSFIGRVFSDGGPEDRLEGSLAAACWAACRNVRVLRVHDVAATRKALAVIDAIRSA